MLVFAHGLEGSPEGRKVQHLRNAGLPIRAPDFRGEDLATRLARLDAETRGAPGPLLLAGSSYGGVCAALLAARHPERFRGLLLLAPALLLPEPPNAPEALAAPAELPTVIIHGRGDTICTLDGSHAYAARSGPHVRVIEVDDGHRLEQSLDRIEAEARALLGA